MQRKFISNNIALTNSADGDILDVYVMEQIGSDWWNGSGITKQNILNEVKGRRLKSINLSISSPGDDVDEALAIKDMLIGTGAPITAEVSGLTASAATIIMMAAGKIKMSSDAFMLIHNTSTIADGNKDDFRKTANELEKFDSVVMYIDTIERPGDFKAVVIDTLLNNRITGRSVWWVNLKPLIRETITIPPKEKPRLYIGASVNIPGNRGDNWGLGPSALATIPKAGAISYSYDVLGNCHTVTFMALIKLKR